MLKCDSKNEIKNYSCNSVYDFLLTFSRLYYAITQRRPK